MQEHQGMTDKRDDSSIPPVQINTLLESIQNPSQQVPGSVAHFLNLLERKILSSKKINVSMCQNITEVILNYLLNTNSKTVQEESAAAVLLAIEVHSPKVVISNFWDQMNLQNLPQPALLRTLGKLILYQGMAPYIGATWSYVLPILRKAQTEEERLGLCNVINGLAINARNHILGNDDDKSMDITQEMLSFKACLTLRVLFNRWPLKIKGKVTEETLSILGNLFFLISPPKLKSQLCWLIRRLLALNKAGVKPFYIVQCLSQLLEAVAASGSGGKNLASKLDDLVVLLSSQVTWKVSNSDSLQNHKIALKSFHIMTRLFHHEMVKLFLKSMDGSDKSNVTLALKIFRDVFQEVPQNTELKNEVMQTIIHLIKEDSKTIRLPLLQFIEKLGTYNYFTLEKGDVVINHLIKLSELGSTSDEETRELSINILHLVSLPRLITLLCQPMRPMAYVPLCKIATDIALKAQALGQPPYLSSYHLKSNEYPSPQVIFVNLLLSSLRPYKLKEFGVCSLWLLYALHPINSLHPVINFKLGQVWTKEIPNMIQILEKHTEENFIQKEWEKRLLLFSSNSLLAIHDDYWLKDFIETIFKKMQSFSWLQQEREKFFLYKLIGHTLKCSDDHNFVFLRLVDILQSPQKEELERKGIGSAISIVATNHLKTVLIVLQDHSKILTDKNTSPVLNLKKELQQEEWIKICNTIYLIYGRIFQEIKSDMGAHADFILSLIINHYENCIIEKDKELTLNYLNSVVMLTNNLANMNLPDFQFSFKIKMVYFMMELVKQEPTVFISNPIRQKAMMIITNFRKLKPPLQVEEKKELLKVCFKYIVGLPPLEVMQKDLSPKESQATANLFRDTLQALRKMLEGLVMEMPNWVQNYLEFLDTWLNSHKDHERERALWCGVRILSFTAKKHNFNVDIEFPRLGQLVKLLAILCQDHVDNISFLASQAVYSLYCIMLHKKKLDQEKKGIWEELPNKEGVYSACVFHNDTSEIAKAFAEYFTPKQVTNLVMTAMEGLIDSRAKISLASGQLMNSAMEERGKDVLKVDEIVDGIYDRLRSQLEPATRRETLQAMCSLAGNNAHNVMTLLLKRPLPWERINMELWRVFGTRRKTTINVLQLLISILEERHPKQGFKEMSFRPVAVTCALCEMLSETTCKLALLELYPRLLLAVLNHVYWVIEQNVPQNMVVYRREDMSGTKSKAFDPVSCALEAVKIMLRAAEYYGVVSYTDQYRGWDLLSSPKYYYMGVIELTSNPWTPLSHPSGLVRNCDPSILHRVMREVKPLLYSVEDRQKIMARACFVQLLWHQSVAQTLGENFLSHLSKWIREPNLIMKEIGLRGISNLALHPGQVGTLASLLPVIRSFLKEEELVAVQAVKGLRNIICYADGIVTKRAFCSIANQLRPLINDERDQVRISATSALSHMLHQVYKFRPGPRTRNALYSFLVPLLISIQDNNIEVAKVCGKALTEWAIGIGWISLRQTFQNTIITDHVKILEETCKCLVSTNQSQLVGKLLFQSFGFLKSPRPFIRAAAITFIGQTVMKLNVNEIHEEDVELLLNALQELNDDPEESIQGLVSITIKKMQTASYVKTSTRSYLRPNLRVPGFGVKKRLFKNIKSKDEGKKKGISKLSKLRHWKMSLWRSSEDSIRQSEPSRINHQRFPRRILPQKYLLSTQDLDKSVHQVQKELKIS
ncbi:maestro heat-like repeat-containing protein family member 1 isoform X2 [Sarcophilus harrisii]|uniref:maestro heat-like repeat-containing protein family member 1 isoform X2 n=1 Tax=Sarcophilus harrisii TaxID=9305 RepID=UPI001301ECF7|nr:maestro heat-like repeat-containing protein family member 1 isoform X2 [Sarcophilus harrisii]